MLKKLFPLFIFFKSALLFSQVPIWHWAKEANSPGMEIAWDVSTDINTGNVYAGGSFDNNLSAKYGPSFTSSYGQLDGLIAKYNSLGTVLWAIKIGGTDDEEIRAVANDPYGNVYVTGYFKSVADFDPSPSTFTLTPTGGSGNADGFLAKYSSAGNFLWAVKFGGAQADDVWKIYADSNYVYLAGQYIAAATFSSTNATTKTTAATQGQLNFFGAKYDQAGIVQWVVSGGSVKDDLAYDVKADNTGVYFCGYFEHNFSIYNSTGVLANSLSIVSPNKGDAFIIKYTQAGAFAWATSAASNDVDIGHGIAQDATNIYVIGSYKNNTINFPGNSPLFTQTNQGGLDIFLAAISKSSGIFQWASSQTGSANGDEEAYEIEKDIYGELILTGYFKSNLDYTPFGGSNFATTGNEDIFLSSYNTSGNFLWSLVAGTNGVDIPYGLTTHTTGAIYNCGTHAGPAVFGTNTLTPGAGTNIFVAKTGCELITNNTAASNQTICSGNAPSTLAGGIPLGGTGTYSYTWQQSTNLTIWTAAVGTNTNQNYSPPPLTVTTYYRRLVSAGGSCASSQSNTLQITVSPLPTVSNAGSSQTICATTYTLNANTPSVGTGSWSVIAGTGTVTSISNPSSTVNGMSVGQNKFVWTISNGGCSSSTSTVTITRDNFPTVSNAGSNQTICATAFTLSGNAPAVGTGSWSVVGGTSTVSAISNPSSAVNGISVGQNNFVWTISNGVCPSSTSTIIISRDNFPTVSNAGSSQTICATTYTLNANTPSVGTGSWSVIAGTGTVTSISNPSSAVNGMSVGQNKFAWTISNGVCPSSSSTVTITRDNFPTISNAGTSQTICATAFTLSGNTPGVGMASWSVVAGTSTVSAISNPSSAVNGISVGQNNFVWTISNGVCPASSSTVTITRDNFPALSNAGTNQTVCATSFTLSGNTPTVGTASWSVISGTGTVSATSNPSSAVNGISVGQNKFVWTISNGVCPASSSTVTITRDNFPTLSNAGTSQTICATTYTFNANTPVIGNGLWSVASGASTVSAISNPSSAVNGISVGQNDFVWTISNGVCPASASTITISRDDFPTASNAGLSQTLCPTSTTLNANTPLVGIGTWSVITGLGNIVSAGNPTTVVNSLSTGQNVFEWIISNGVCPASSSTVSVTKDQSPTISNAGTDQNLCASLTTLNANTPSVGTGQWIVSAGSSTVSASNNPSSAVSGLSIGQNKFVWIISYGTCPPSTDTVIVYRDQLPTTAVAGNSQTVCATSSTLNANTPLIGTGTWSVISGSSSLNSFTNQLSVASGLSVGQNQFAWTISNGTCPSSSSTVTINRDDYPSSPNAGNDQSICSPSIALNANSPLVGAGQWLIPTGSSTSSNLNNSSIIVSGLNIGQNIFVWTITNGVCPSAPDTVFINQDANPSISNAGVDQHICGGNTILAANAPAIGTGNWMLISGNGNFVNNSNSTTTISGLNPGINKLVWIISNGVCPSSADTLTILSDENPTIANAGNDNRICADTITLSANAPTVGTGLWILVSGSGTISNVNQNNSSVTNLGVGANVFRWTIVNGLCPASTDDIIISKDLPPSPAIAGPDQTIDKPIADLSATSPSVGTGFWSVINGSGEIYNITNPNTGITGLSIGNNIIRWTMRNGVCPESTDDVIIYVNPLNIPNGFSPNQDGFNDTFVIPSLEYYPNVKFNVFNRWGGEVFVSNDYKNNWNGTNLSNEKLADDTYYYVLEINSKLNFTGFIVLKQNK